LRELDQDGMHKIIGKNGVFATEMGSNAATASDNTPFIDLIATASGQDAAAEGSALVQYLVGAGLPSDQIASVSEDGVGKISGDGGSGELDVSAEVPMLARAYEGIPIEDSFAWAALADDGLSYGEQVFWPEIGGDVVTELKAFKQMLADPHEAPPSSRRFRAATGRS
jgi:hypothetical protein